MQSQAPDTTVEEQENTIHLWVRDDGEIGVECDGTVGYVVNHTTNVVYTSEGEMFFFESDKILDDRHKGVITSSVVADYVRDHTESGHYPLTHVGDLPDDDKFRFGVARTRKQGHGYDHSALYLRPIDGEDDRPANYGKLMNALQDVLGEVNHNEVAAPDDADHLDVYTLDDLCSSYDITLGDDDHEGDVDADDHEGDVDADRHSRYSHTAENTWERGDGDMHELCATMTVIDTETDESYDLFLSNTVDVGFSVTRNDGDDLPDDVREYADDHSPMPTCIRMSPEHANPLRGGI